MKKKVKRVVAAAKEKEGKKITELLEKKNSKALQYVFKLCKQSKKDKKDIPGRRNALYAWKRWKAKGDTAREN